MAGIEAAGLSPAGVTTLPQDVGAANTPTTTDALLSSPTTAETLLASGNFPQSSGWTSDNPHGLFGREFSESITLVNAGDGFRAQAELTVTKEFDGQVLRVDGDVVAGEFNQGDGVPDRIQMQEWITVRFNDGRSMDFQLGGEISADGGGASIGGGSSWEPVQRGDYNTFVVRDQYQTTRNFSATIALPAGVDGNDVASFQYKMNADFVVDGNRVQRSVMSPPLRVN